QERAAEIAYAQVEAARTHTDVGIIDAGPVRPAQGVREPFVLQLQQDADARAVPVCWNATPGPRSSGSNTWVGRGAAGLSARRSPPRPDDRVRPRRVPRPGRGDGSLHRRIHSRARAPRMHGWHRPWPDPVAANR